MALPCNTCAQLKNRIEKYQLKVAALEALISQSMHRVDRIVEYLSEEIGNSTVPPRQLISDIHAQLANLLEYTTDARNRERKTFV